MAQFVEPLLHNPGDLGLEPKTHIKGYQGFTHL